VSKSLIFRLPLIKFQREKGEIKNKFIAKEKSRHYLFRSVSIFEKQTIDDESIEKLF